MQSIIVTKKWGMFLLVFFFISWLVFRAFIWTSVSKQQADAVAVCAESPECLAHSHFVSYLRAPQHERLLFHMEKKL